MSFFYFAQLLLCDALPHEMILDRDSFQFPGFIVGNSAHG